MDLFNDRHIRILKERNDKLFNLILDLDHTLIHTKTYKINEFYEDMTEDENKLCNFTLYDYHHIVYIRKNLFTFLNSLKLYYNIYIYTDGTDEYSLQIYKYFNIKADNAIVGIISRNSKKPPNSILNHKNLDILPCFDVLNTIIIDDRIDVWHQNSHKNLIQIKEYIYNPDLDSLDLNNSCDGSYEHLDALRELLMNYNNTITEELLHKSIYEINALYKIFERLSSISKYAVNIFKSVLE